MNRLSKTNEETETSDTDDGRYEAQSVANSLEDDDSNYEIAIDLRDFLSKRKVIRPDTILNSIVDKELHFLKNNSNVVSRTEKNEEVEKILNENRNRKSADYVKSQIKSVNAKLNQNRNPSVMNFLKDVEKNDENPTKTARSNNELTLDKLQDSLKKEFNSFLATTIDSSLQTVKNVKSAKKSTRTHRDKIFLTQQDDEIDQELGDLVGNTTRNNSSRVINRDSKMLGNRNSELDKKSKMSESRMQVVLVGGDGEEEKEVNESQKSVIRLKKMIDSIKKVDLPKFQTELHQICQYGADPQLFKFYPRVYFYEQFYVYYYE